MHFLSFIGIGIDGSFVMFESYLEMGVYCFISGACSGCLNIFGDTHYRSCAIIIIFQEEINLVIFGRKEILIELLSWG